jgi:hypothetical protein
MTDEQPATPRPRDARDTHGAPGGAAPREIGPAQPRQIDRPERQTEAIVDRKPGNRR